MVENEILLKGVLKAIRTNAFTDKVTEVEIVYEIHKGEKYNVFHLIGGSTGYESFRLDERDTLEKMTESGWLACYGTKRRYDKLMVDAEEMKKVHDVYKEKVE